MLNTVYRLVAPRRFEAKFKEVSLDKENVLVRPTYLSICNADQRYYQGLRSAEILKKKLPMALIHEGIGEIVWDPSGTFRRGDVVVMIPNMPVEQDEVIAENYLRSSMFRSSGHDGFMQDYICMPKDRLLKISNNIKCEVAAFIELVSVSYHSIQRFEEFSHKRKDAIGVWGDGNLGYITALLLKTMFPERKIIAVGVNREKLSHFTFADEIYLTYELSEDFAVDHGFECVGGMYSGKAINQIIDVIHPEGTISILGVSENNVELNTRMILEKGLRIYGSSRSGRKDFEGVVKLLEENQIVERYLETLVHSVIPVNEIGDIIKGFEADQQKNIGKTIMHWKI